MDFLLTKLESVKEDIDIMNADDGDAVPLYYRAGVLAAWSKINTYYELTDQSPVYRMVSHIWPTLNYNTQPLDELQQHSQEWLHS
ncbi:hypothetical protein E5D57_007914 [Metarhizium anisopliae]|nr:hypothetical protein E5D57_007914 [Metarhizium anisopliae]